MDELLKIRVLVGLDIYTRIPQSPEMRSGYLRFENREQRLEYGWNPTINQRWKL
jgi:hypothetical protein